MTPTSVILTVAASSLVLLLAPLSPASAQQADAEPRLFMEALDSLSQHINGEEKLSNEDVQELTKTIREHETALAGSKEAVKEAMNLVASFDKNEGPLWLKHEPLHNKKKKAENATKWAVFWVMQNLMDQVYDNAGMQHYSELIDGFKFGSAEHFPGKVEAPLDPDAVHTVKINGSYPETWGAPFFHMDRPARKPTGTYLVPGSIATVTVPEALVNQGYLIRVGAHSWDHRNKPRVLRLYRVSPVYEITSTEMQVANPLGGGIYIEVPYKADAGIVEVSVQNAVRSPYFSWKSFHKTSLKEWRQVERKRKAPWADFQSETYMMQVPTSWIYALDDPKTLMKNWDKALEATNKLMGYPPHFGKETLYTQVDTQLRGRAFHPGYPAGNRNYDPNKDYGGYHTHHLVRGPQKAHSYELHELGHAYLFPKYAGDREAAVNLPHVAAMNRAFGVDLNTAFRDSRSQSNPFFTVDSTAVTWMMSQNFVKDGFMKGYERQYQLKGHAKFVDIARLFGWEALDSFWRSLNQDYMDGNPWPRNNGEEDGDRYTVRLSKSAGADLRPLIHFWGIPIVNEEKTDAAIRNAGINPSAKVYDQLIAYKKRIPADNKAFREFARKWWQKEPSPDGYTTERNHAAYWDSYDEEQAARVRSTVQGIVDRYFPNGRPENGK